MRVHYAKDNTEFQSVTVFVFFLFAIHSHWFLLCPVESIALLRGISIVNTGETLPDTDRSQTGFHKLPKSGKFSLSRRTPPQEENLLLILA